MRFPFLFLFLIGGLTSLLAQTGNLYGSGISDSDVLVRLINAQASNAATLRLGPARLETPSPGSVTSYHPIAVDIYVLRYEGISIEFIPRTGALYTIIAAGSQGLLILEDEAHNDPVRAQIYVYNMAFGSLPKNATAAESAPPDSPESNTEGKLSIKTADGQLELFRSLLPGRSAHQVVNAVRVELAVFDSGGKSKSDSFELNLHRGSSTTVLLLTGPEGMVEVFPVLADIDGQ